MIDSRTVALLGFARTGKSTYLGALWQIIQDPTQTHIVEEEVTGDRSYVDELGAQVANATEIPRTEVESQGRLAIRLRFEGDGVLTVDIPDLSGENARQLVEDRVWRKSLEEAIEDADALIVFVHPERIEAPVPIALANAAVAIVGGAAPGDVPEQANKPVFSSDQACTAAKLVELLENILEASERSAPLSIAVVVSAWDTAADGRTPTAWLAENLAGVHDMLVGNPDLVRFGVFGVSAQGGKLPDQQQELLGRGDVAQRVYAVDRDGRPVPLSEPLRWAVWS